MAITPEIEIDANVPTPLLKRGKYPFRAMKVGDSFFVAGVPIQKLVNASFNYRKEGQKYTARTVDGGARIWRIA